MVEFPSSVGRLTNLTNMESATLWISKWVCFCFQAAASTLTRFLVCLVAGSTLIVVQTQHDPVVRPLQCWSGRARFCPATQVQRCTASARVQQATHAQTKESFKRKLPSVRVKQRTGKRRRVDSDSDSVRHKVKQVGCERGTTRLRQQQHQQQRQQRVCRA